MDVRKIRENLGRIKIYYLKGETLRALGFAVMALKDVVRAGGAPPPCMLSLRRKPKTN